MRIAIEWRIKDEKTGEWWYDPGTIVPKVFPSKASAMQALRNIQDAIKRGRTDQFGHRYRDDRLGKPEPIVVSTIKTKEELSEIQRKTGARVVA